jgi:hypothetical protein
MIGERGRNGASALEIGIAMASGTPACQRMGMVAKENLGLEMAARLVREGVAAATRGNLFMLAKLSDETVPPLVRCEDMPSPGFQFIPPKHAPGPRRESSLLLATMVFDCDAVWFVPLSTVMPMPASAVVFDGDGEWWYPLSGS